MHVQIGLDEPELEWIGKRFLDPTGRVFKLGGVYHRAIYKAQVPFVEGLLPLIDELAEDGLVPAQTFHRVDHRDYGAIMKAETAEWKVFAVRYPVDALKEAALVWLKINQKLLDRGLGLRDGHYGNFALFGNGTPKWVDLGSITTLERDRIGLVEFMRSFVYPLLIMAAQPRKIRNKEQILRPGGILKAQARRVLEAGHAQFKGEQGVVLWQPERLSRKRIVQGLIGLIRPLIFSGYQDRWSKYRSESSLKRALETEAIYAALDQRDRVILDLVKSLKPTRVFDVGANIGYHACMIANQGIPVLAIDADEYAINTCYRWIRDKPQLPLCASVDSFMKTNHKADVVISLALTHHLSLSQKLSFESIAERYSNMTERHLLVEFMPNGLGSTVKKPDPLPGFYNIEGFMQALRKHFAEVRLVNYSRGEEKLALRTLVHCAKVAQ